MPGKIANIIFPGIITDPLCARLISQWLQLLLDCNLGVLADMGYENLYHPCIHIQTGF